MPDLPLNDITLHYEVDGNGPPLLLLAGMLSDSASWGPLVALLSEKFTVIRPDNRSTGRTVMNDAPVDCALMAQDAVALMDHLGHEKFHCAGHSLGGLLTLEIASAHPDRVGTASILASGRFRAFRIGAMFRSLLSIRQAPQGEDLWLRALYPWAFGDAFFRDPATLETAIEAARAYPHAQSAADMARQIDAFAAFRPAAKLDQITMPSLVIYGEQDVMVDPAKARESFAGLPNATHHTIADAGHSVVWDAPDDVASQMGEFLAKHPF